MNSRRFLHFYFLALFLVMGFSMGDWLISVFLIPVEVMMEATSQSFSLLVGSRSESFESTMTNPIVLVSILLTYFMTIRILKAFDGEILAVQTSDDAEPEDDAEIVKRNADVDAYISGDIPLDELESRLEDEWDDVGVGVPERDDGEEIARPQREIGDSQ